MPSSASRRVILAVIPSLHIVIMHMLASHPPKVETERSKVIECMVFFLFLLFAQKKTARGLITLISITPGCEEVNAQI